MPPAPVLSTQLWRNVIKFTDLPNPARDDRARHPGGVCGARAIPSRHYCEARFASNSWKEVAMSIITNIPEAMLTEHVNWHTRRIPVSAPAVR